MRIFWLVGTAVPAFCLGFAEVQNLPTKLIYNGSESAPPGFYWIENLPVKRGDYVLTNVPKRFKMLINQRGYVRHDVPLLKQIIAIEGDVICRKDREILLNGVTIAVARLLDQSSRKLPIWQGCHRLMSDDLFLLQDHPSSFDSRYFGPVQRSLVIGKATKLRFPDRSDENDDPK